MKKLYLLLCIFASSLFGSMLFGQETLDDVMFQSFGWDEYQQTRVSNEGGLYAYYTSRADLLAEVGIDMIWFPPPSHSTGGVGYLPTEYFKFDLTSWGTEDQLDAMLTAMNSAGIHPIADIVVNHRNGTTSWMDFSNPTWDCSAITSTDEAATDPGNTTGIIPCGNADTGDDFNGGRDLDHTNATVRNDVKTYLNMLKAKGFEGWRYDVAKGFASVYFGEYNESSSPYFSVGEYWDGNYSNLKNWINGTGNTLSGTTTPSAAFDFSLYYSLSNALRNGAYSGLNNGGSMAGLAGQYGYSDKAVTFVDNHDTFVHAEAFLGNNIMKAYAYTLTHPGIPCVFGPHYYGGTYSKDGVTRSYPTTNKSAINKLIKIRKETGIDAYSSVTIDVASSYYAAYIKQRSSDADYVVAVKVGPGTWSPSGSGWILSTYGTDYAVWTKTTINAAPDLEMLPTTTSYVTGNSASISFTTSDPENDAVTVYYTTHGSTPTTSSTVYSGAFNITSTTTINAIAVDANGNSSGVVSKTYTFSSPDSITIYFQPPTSNPSGWIPPYIHYWGIVPGGAGSDWANPPVMEAVAAFPGWYSYTFTDIVSVNFLFRVASATSWTTGATKTGDIVTVTEDTWYVWDPTSSSYVSTTDPLAVNDVAELAENVSLKVVPNPVVNGKASVEFAKAKNGKINVFDMNGKLLKTVSLNSADGAENIQMNYPAGLYILQLVSDNGTVSVKAMVK